MAKVKGEACVAPLDSYIRGGEARCDRYLTLTLVHARSSDPDRPHVSPSLTPLSLRRLGIAIA